MKKTVLAVAVSLLAIGSADAQQRKPEPPKTPENPLAVKRCRTIQWTPGDIIPIEVSLTKNTHITLPEAALDLLWGPKELWDIEAVESDVFAIAKNNTPYGKETSLTVIGKSKNAYELELIRVDKLSSHCVNITAKAGLINRQKWSESENATNAQIAMLQQQLARANAERATERQIAEQEAKRQVNESVKAYRSSITSNYTWDKGSGWFAEGAQIESVYDDGRFTYIRLAGDERGIMSVLADVDGKMEILEKFYDANKREYKVAGIYPKFILKAGSSELTINRKG